MSRVLVLVAQLKKSHFSGLVGRPVLVSYQFGIKACGWTDWVTCSSCVMVVVSGTGLSYHRMTTVSPGWVTTGYSVQLPAAGSWLEL